MPADPGGRQEVSGDELRLLADRASNTSAGVDAVRLRVQDIVNGVDRRGWNAAAFDDQWARTRFGLAGLSQELDAMHAELLARGSEADLLNTRLAAPLSLDAAATVPAAQGLAADAPALGQFLEGLAGLLPTLNMPTLDPNGPIARTARGETVNPFEWSRELADYEAQTILAGAPAEVRDAQVTVSVAGIGQQTISTQALLVLALDPANLIAGPEDRAGIAAVEKALPYLDGPARSAAERLLEAWVSRLRTMETPATFVNNLYERAQTGGLNYLVHGGTSQIWADGVRTADGFLQEAKYIGNPARSPYIADSLCPTFVRESAQRQVDDEFARYAAVLADPNTLVHSLEVVVSDERAVAFFQAAMDKYAIKGRVMVRPWTP